MSQFNMTIKNKYNKYKTTQGHL